MRAEEPLNTFYLKVTILGTGTSQGVPVIGSTHPVCQSDDPRDKRFRVSAMIQIGGKTLVIDCGPDFRQQMLANDVQNLDAVLFTHEHADHTAGLDDLRPFYFKQGAVHLYMEKRVHESLKQRFEYIFREKDKYPGVADLTVHHFDDEPFTAADMEIIPIRAHHGNLPIYGFRVRDFAYLTDVKTLPQASRKKLAGLDVLVLNMLRKEPHHTHLNLKEAMEMVEDLQPKQVYFTHLSHHIGFHAEVDENLPEGVNLAYDNLTIDL